MPPQPLLYFKFVEVAQWFLKCLLTHHKQTKTITFAVELFGNLVIHLVK